MGIAVLGPLVVDGADRIGPRDRVVLTALCVRPGEVVRADQLADALWDERPPRSWGKVVQGCVMRLRKAVGAQAIETYAGGYRLVLPADEVDSRRFERLVGRARELLTFGEPERAGYVVGEALALWRGAPLVELDGWDAGRIEAARLEELRLDAEELQIDAALRSGHYREVLGAAQARVAEAPVRERRWALLALAQYQAGRQAEALRTLRQVRTVLARELGLDPGPDLVALEQAILDQDPSLVADVALPEPSATCPYLGLVPYDIGDEDAFFGRDAEVDACRRRLDELGVLIVVGPSGNGKSSLVRAGLGAGLQRDGRDLVVITPGARPMDALTALPASGPAPVLVVDQAEEAVSLCTDEGERSRFFGALAEYAERARLVVALRADRLGEVSAYPAFSRLVERGLYLLGPMGEDDLRAAIEGPAHQAGLLVEPGLVDVLLQEVKDESGALPLLSHALRETWQGREGRTLTLAGYRDTGGIRGAVAQSAEGLYERVPPAQRPLLRGLLLRLVAPVGGGAPLRSRLPRRVVATDEEHDRLIEMLIGARLVTSDDGVVELAHEALARAWPRLQEWLNDDIEGQRILHHLSGVADTWDALGRPDSELYRGVRLAQALDWRDQADPDLTPTERDFLEAARGQVEAELVSARRRAEQEFKARRRTRRLASGLAAALALALVAAALAAVFRGTAESRAQLADANRLAALSRSANELDLSLLLAVAAAQTADTPQTRDGLLTALAEHRRATRVTQVGGPVEDLDLGGGGTIFADLRFEVVALSPGSTTGPVTVTDEWFGPVNIDASPIDDLVAVVGLVRDAPRVGVFTAEGEERLMIPLDGWPTEVAFTPDGRGLLIAFYLSPGGGRAGVQYVDLATGQGRMIHEQVHRSPDAEAFVDATFADDGSAVAMWTSEPNEATTVLDLGDGSRTMLRLQPRPSKSVSFQPVPGGSAQLWADGAITTYDSRGRPTQVLEAHQGLVRDVLVSPDGDLATTTSDDGVVHVWDIDQRSGQWARRETLTGHSGTVFGAELALDGRTVITGSRDQSLIEWDMSTDAGFGTTYPGLDGRWISNRPQMVTPERLLVAPTRSVTRVGDNGFAPAPDTLDVAATFLDPATGRVVDEVAVGDTADGPMLGSSVAVSPDGRMVAVTSTVATTVLDTRTRERLGRIALPPASDGDPEPVWAAGWTRGGDRLLLGAAGPALDGAGGLVVVDPRSWTVERRISLGGPVQVIESSPDDRLLAVGEEVTGGSDHTPEVWILDAATLEVRRTLHLSDGDFPLAMSFSPDGRLVASGGYQGKITVVDVETGQRVTEPVDVHEGFLQQLEWRPDARTVVSSGTDGTVALVDSERGLVRAVPMPGSSDPGGDYLQGTYTHLVPGTVDEVVSLSGARTGHRYPLDPSQWLDHACSVAGRDLSRAEWARYLPDQPYRQTCSGK